MTFIERQALDSIEVLLEDGAAHLPPEVRETCERAAGQLRWWLAEMESLAS